jgi:hypothetical protein
MGKSIQRDAGAEVLKNQPLAAGAAPRLAQAHRNQAAALSDVKVKTASAAPFKKTGRDAST